MDNFFDLIGVVYRGGVIGGGGGGGGGGAEMNRLLFVPVLNMLFIIEAGFE